MGSNLPLLIEIFFNRDCSQVIQSGQYIHQYNSSGKFSGEEKQEHDILIYLALGRVKRKVLVHSASQHGHLIS